MIDRRSLLAVAAAALVLSPAARAAEIKTHRVAIHVDDNDPARMNLALNNASNITQYYSDKGEEVEVEIVAYGPGLHMLRADTSPVKDRLKSFTQSMPNVAFAACGNTQQNMSKAEGKPVEILPGIKVVPAGVVHLMELQEKGWTYIKP
jgi:intracellular sulfur oxidation DsrE/DsrF family protein